MSTHLKKTLSPILLWGLGVGYVISGMYFGWNYGLEKGGTYGMGIATIIIAIMYVCFSFSYSELACAIPKAGGGFDYANRAFGKDIGFITGLAQVIEFVFAPPAIAYAIGAYLNLSFPQIDVIYFAIIAYVIFTTLNIIGVKLAATFELLITIIAIGELLLFFGVTIPHFSVENFNHNPSINGWGGVFAAIPFAIWFFLGIEGVANVAEESINPQKDITKGFGSAMLTLIILCALVYVAAIGVGGWEKIVYKADGSLTDSPLPMAMSLVVSQNSTMYRLLIGVGLFGLIASFHGLILAGGRATMELGKVNYAPKFLGKLDKKHLTPANALIVNMILGIIALFTNKTGDIITVAVFGALTLYVISMMSLIKLRKTEPDLKRPFVVPFYPILPIVALVIGIISIIAMSYYNQSLAFWYFGTIALGYLAFKMFYKSK
ncbi:ethanolamine permease [Flavobacterium soyangense]|uniref:Ethanolamine permease n=1 Tax=Flavobacterium soyangense TaxID=2023265 RepID=A0A930U767_9FLAO|nr:ethanolamine permease [Flavobacterium soyangense]MBF2708163.1 ethanolamine permease [Flavobacterium soyangense]